MLKAIAVLVAATALLPGSAAAAAICHPIDAGTRVLASANPNDLAPDWTGESYIGLDWSLVRSSQQRDDSTGLDFIEGQLRSPRGGEQGDVFGLAREWRCTAQ